MRGFISISKRQAGIANFCLLGALLWVFVPVAIQSFCATPAYAAGGSDRPIQDDEDFTPTPSMGYGEFNEESEEEADAQFFQHGRFFGVSIGLGTETVDGYRGVLWQGGFPTFDFKLHYWFDFNVALDLGATISTHYFQTDVGGRGHVDVSMVRAGVDLKYYFDTKNLSAPISFANPYVLLGAGNFTKTENSFTQGISEPQSSIGLSGGGGLEFAIKPRKLYFELEAKIHVVNFRDTHTTEYQKQDPSLPDLTGRFYTFTGNILFTW